MLGNKRTCYQLRKTESVDSGGALTEEWQEIKKFKGFLRSMRGKELFAFSREMANITYKLICDYIADIDISDQIRIEDRVYDIQHVDDTLPNKTKLYLELRI